MIYIIGGIKRRTQIKVPSTTVRPTSVKKRESIFSIIESVGLKMKINIYKNANILDLYSGSGALGLEAISRGANFAFFYENNKKNSMLLKYNCQKICNKNFKIINENIIKSNFNVINKKISLVFIDPPYKTNPFEGILHKLNSSKILKNSAIIIIETEKNIKIKIPIFFICFKEKNYGRTKLIFLTKKI